MARVADFYTEAYLQTHMQRYQMALQMAQQQQASQMVVAQMLGEQLKALDKQIASVKAAKTSGELNGLIRAYQLKQTVLSDTARRQISIYDQVNDIFDTSAALPTIGNAADTFANSLATAGSIKSKAERHAGTVGGYSRGTEQAKAVAAATYTAFKADAYRKGKQTTFDANDATIRKAIADTMGIQVSDIDTVDAQREKMLQDRLDKQGVPAIDETDLDALIASQQPDADADPAAQKSAIDQLLLARTQLSEAQMGAIQQATASPQEQIQRAKNIYRSQFAPIATQQKQAFTNYLKGLPATEQMIMLGFTETKPRDVAYMKKPAQEIARMTDEKKKLAYSLFHANQAAIKEGQVPKTLVHLEVQKAFPNDTVAQQQVLGHIFRAQAELNNQSIEATQEKTAEIDRKADELYGKQQQREQEDRNMFQKGFDAFSDLFTSRIVKETAATRTGEPKPTDEPKPVEEEVDEVKVDEPKPVEEEVKVEEEVAPTPANIQHKAPSWYKAGDTVFKTPEGGYEVVSPTYGTFTLDSSGKITSGSIKRGTRAGHFADLQKTKPLPPPAEQEE